MSRIENKFQQLKANNRKALITFVTSGDPDAQTSSSVINKMAESGADFIEIGMPFTDPMADGPAIQASSLRALDSGMTIKGVIALVRDFRAQDQETPIILMGYFNPIYQYGCDAFVKDAKHAGADGLIIVDLPPEEDQELREPAQAVGLDFIKLITPTTKGERLDNVLQNASGFLYYVSIAGVTGSKSANVDAVGTHIVDIKKKTDLPVVVGFGIKTPEQASEMAKIADGVVVGSAIVDNIAANYNNDGLTSVIEKQVQDLKNAI